MPRAGGSLPSPPAALLASPDGTRACCGTRPRTPFRTIQPTQAVARTQGGPHVADTSNRPHFERPSPAPRASGVRRPASGTERSPEMQKRGHSSCCDPVSAFPGIFLCRTPDAGRRTLGGPATDVRSVGDSKCRRHAVPPASSPQLASAGSSGTACAAECRSTRGFRQATQAEPRAGSAGSRPPGAYEGPGSVPSRPGCWPAGRPEAVLSVIVVSGQPVSAPSTRRGPAATGRWVNRTGSRSSSER
ncbi:MAG: hypothetical protein JWR66_1753 [Modestobacter sp.]|nr:hypothetical protein [Modestobacter sp.]